MKSTKPTETASLWQSAVALAKGTWAAFSGTRASARGAAIAFYTVTAVVPVLILVIAVSGLIFGREAASGALFAQFTSLLGQEGSELLEKAVAGAGDTEESTIATVVSILTLLLTTSGVFLELDAAFDAIWEAKPKESLAYTAKARAISIGLVIAFGFVMIASLVIDTALTRLGEALKASLPFGAALLFAINAAISFALLAAVMTGIMKFLPAPVVAWRHAMPGGVATAFLFTIGKTLIGLYLGHNATISSLGAAGALLILLFWVYFTAQITLMGAAFTRTWARRAECNAAAA